MLHSTATGLATGLALIVAIGAQNAFVLRQGLAREHVGVVVAICALSDLLLILAGVSGVGVVVERAPWALDVVRWLGVAFLTAYGVRTLLRARTAQTLEVARRGAGSRSAAVAGALALTWLNPHVYLDTVLVLGSVASQQGDPGRWWFGAGACLGSIVWFAGLGYGARVAQPLLATPRAWQVLDLVIGTTMVVIAGALAWG